MPLVQRLFSPGNVFILKKDSYTWEPGGDFTRARLTHEEQIVTIVEKSLGTFLPEIVVCNSKSEIFSVFQHNLLDIDWEST